MDRSNSKAIQMRRSHPSRGQVRSSRVRDSIGTRRFVRGAARVIDIRRKRLGLRRFGRNRFAVRGPNIGRGARVYSVRFGGWNAGHGMAPLIPGDPPGDDRCPCAWGSPAASRAGAPGARVDRAPFGTRPLLPCTQARGWPACAYFSALTGDADLREFTAEPAALLRHRQALG